MGEEGGGVEDDIMLAGGPSGPPLSSPIPPPLTDVRHLSGIKRKQQEDSRAARGSSRMKITSEPYVHTRVARGYRPPTHCTRYPRLSGRKGDRRLRSVMREVTDWWIW